MLDKFIKVSKNGIHFNVFGHVDLEGNPVKRPRSQYPYSYSPYVQFRNGENTEIENAVYSDRLHQWDYKKYNSLSKKHFGNEGQCFSNRSPDKVQSFLRDYLDNQNLKLIVIQEGANMSSGYPYWIFHYSAS